MNKYIAILMFVFSQMSQACMCTESSSSIGELYKNANAIYLVAISKIEAINVTGGRADLDIDLRVLFTYKGKDREVIKAGGARSFPTLTTDGSYRSEATSCDSDYSVGQQYLVAVFVKEEVQLQQCSRNILPKSRKNLESLADLSTSKK